MTRFRPRIKQTVRTTGLHGRNISSKRKRPMNHTNSCVVLLLVLGVLLIFLFSPGRLGDEELDIFPSYEDILAKSSNSGTSQNRDATDESVANSGGLPNTLAEMNEQIQTSPQDASGAKNPIRIAYVVSLIECTDNHKSGQSSVAGLQDGSIVLRHSIHQNSVRNPASGSKYDYEMYAIIHEKASGCAPILEDVGFKVLIKDPPVVKSDIRGDYLRKTIHKEVCCGADEFVKLHAYTIPAPLVVHLDIDFIVKKPMDAVFDAILGGNETSRSMVEREDPMVAWPERIEAAITRDYTSAYPGRKAGFQAGFWIVRPSHTHFEKLVEIIKEGNYVEGFERNNGWGGQGYGGFVGAKAMQGLIAYYYDIHVPGTWIELNNCRYNAVQAKVTKKGKCLSGREECEDCRTTNIEDIYSFHYTACRKPWSCIAKDSKDPLNTNGRKFSIPTDIVLLEQCMASRKVWHDCRRDLETKLFALTGDQEILRSQRGNYSNSFFLGHCTEDQSTGYLRIGGSTESLRRLRELYEV